MVVRLAVRTERGSPINAIGKIYYGILQDLPGDFGWVLRDSIINGELIIPARVVSSPLVNLFNHAISSFRFLFYIQKHPSVIQFTMATYALPQIQKPAP